MARYVVAVSVSSRACGAVSPEGRLYSRGCLGGFGGGPPRSGASQSSSPSVLSEVGWRTGVSAVEDVGEKRRS
jgi:hypothetical protein